MFFSLRDIFIFLLISIAYAGYAYAEKIYTWKDEHGNTHFGDKPGGNIAQEIRIKSTSVGDASGQQRAERTKKYLDALSEDRQEREQAREKAKLEKQERAEKCAAAKKAQREASEAQFLYTESESGEKNILSFEQRAAEEQKAANKVRKFCGNN